MQRRRDAEPAPGPLDHRTSSRSKKRRKNREEKENQPPFDFWNSDELPTDAQLKNFEKNPTAAVAMFHLMAGIPADSRVCPEISPVQFDREYVMKRWVAEMGHDVKIGVCATCGGRVIMTEGEFKILGPENSLLECCKADEEKLPPVGSVLRNSLHLVTIGENTFRLAPQGVENNKITVCKKCQSYLYYANNTKNKAPEGTIAHYDLGRYPSHLRKLSQYEMLAISPVCLFVPIHEFRAVAGSRCKGLRGHTFAMMMSESDSIASAVNRPRRLGRRFKLAILGHQGTWKLAKDLARKGILSFCLEEMLPWAVWFKKIGHPSFQNKHFISSKEEFDEAKSFLLNAVEEIIANAACSNSGLINKMAERNRERVEDEKDNLDENMEGDLLTNVFLCQAPKLNEEPMQKILKKMQELLPSDEKDEKDEKDDAPIPITILNRMVCGYTENHLLLSGAFAHLFPFGLTEENMGTGTVRLKMMDYWMNFYDRRFATDFNLLALLFDQKMRSAVNGVSFRINKSCDRENDLIDLMSEPGFRQKILASIREPKSEAAREIKKKLQPFLKIIGGKIDWTPLHRSGTLGKLYAMAQFFNSANIFGTISPAMRHSTLALRLTLSDNGENYSLPSVFLRSKAIAENPVAAVQVFYRLMRKFFDIVMGLPLDHFNGKRANVSRLLSRNRDKFIGAYGRPNAVYGVIEDQANTSLHVHWNAYGIWDIDVVQRHIHKPEFAKTMTDMIDSIVTCRVPPSIRQIPVPDPYPVFMSEPYPDASKIDEDSAWLARFFNNHKHSFTCWKNSKCPHCRMAYARQLAIQGTYATEIHKDPTVKDKVVPVRKFPGSAPGTEIISEPPPRPEGNPFREAFRINRCTVQGLGRMDNFEQYQSERNPTTTSCTRTNTSIQVLFTPSKQSLPLTTQAVICLRILTPFKKLSRCYFKPQRRTKNTVPKLPMMELLHEKRKIFCKKF